MNDDRNQGDLDQSFVIGIQKTDGDITDGSSQRPGGGETFVQHILSERLEFTTGNRTQKSCPEFTKGLQTCEIQRQETLDFGHMDSKVS